MKSTPKQEPLRGEAAWRAEKAAIAQRNEAACAKAMNERGKRDAAVEKERRAADRRDFAATPKQPQH
jgi:hypothetical protein